MKSQFMNKPGVTEGVIFKVTDNIIIIVILGGLKSQLVNKRAVIKRCILFLSRVILRKIYKKKLLNLQGILIT